jgi:hypothetical protein
VFQGILISFLCFEDSQEREREREAEIKDAMQFLKKKQK